MATWRREWDSNPRYGSRGRYPADQQGWYGGPHQFHARDDIFGTQRTRSISLKYNKINEAGPYSPAHNGLVAGSSPGERFTISIADHLHSGEELRPRLQKFVAAIALSRGKEIEKREPLLSFALVSKCTMHFRNHFASAWRNASCGITFSDALFIGRCTKLRQGGA